MASRTKSFFEQDHKANYKPQQWRRNYINKQPLGEVDPNVISATSQTKTKLKAFQFIPGQPEGAGRTVASDENNIDSEDSGKHSGNNFSVAQDSEMQGGCSSAPNRRSDGLSGHALAQSTRTPSLPHANTFPCTPSERLPLDDLIGNYDENAKPLAEEEASPEEQLGWMPNSSNTMTPHRRRKRAQSSSPSCPATSSQRHEASTFFGGNFTIAEKKTPEADLTATLWQTYGGGKDTGSAVKLPDFSRLVAQASPRPIETPIKSAGFRRWASAGNEWPSSKNKRRRTDARTSIGVWREEREGELVGGKSKVATMVDRIQETLATQKLVHSTVKPARPDGSSSSMIIPEARNEGVHAHVSPLQDKPQAPTALQAPLADNDDQSAPSVALLDDAMQILQPNAGLPRPSTSKVHSLSPDRPDPPLNISRTVGQASDSIISAPLHFQSKALPAYKRPSVSASGRQYPVKQPSQPVAAPIVNSELDDFGDDFDLTAEDLDELASQIPLEQRSLHQIPAHPNPPPPQPISFRVGTPEPIITLDDDDDDEFGGDDLDADALISPRKRSPRKSPVKSTGALIHTHSEPDNAVTKLRRYKVTSIRDGDYTNANGRRCSERVVLAEHHRTSKPTAITLRDSWSLSTIVNVGNIVHVAEIPGLPTSADPPGQITIGDHENSALLIIHPDSMLSATTVGDSFDCVRKAVFKEHIKATSEANTGMVYGSILHEVFQQALLANDMDHGLVELVERTIQNHVEGLWELGMKDTVLAREEVLAKMGELAGWAKAYVAEQPGDASVIDDKYGEKVWMSVSKLVAIEEHIWSPLFGLKGNIDATVQTTLLDDPRQPTKRLLAPLEVKTGRTTQSVEHRAQTALYTLLLSDRYDLAVKAGILYYLESATTSRIAPPAIEIRQMVQSRNRLAAYIYAAKHPGMQAGHTLATPLQAQDIEDSASLPQLLKNPFKCGRCYAQQTCFTYHALSEAGSAQSAGMIDDGKKNHSLVWHEAVGHLLSNAGRKTETEQLKKWFMRWDRLLTFEEGETSRVRKELWTMTSAEREAVGRCFGNLVLHQDLTSAAASATQADGIEGSGGKINRYTYVFRRAIPIAGASFAEGTQLTAGEPIVVSSEHGQWALANGYVVSVTKHEFTVAVDRKLGDARQRMAGFDEVNNHAFQGIMTVSKESEMTATQQAMLYRVDKDEFANGLALVRSNLISLMSSHPIPTKLRQQVIHKSAPIFCPPSQLPALQQSQLGQMNEDQQAAVAKVLSAQDYALILGMPGTGKTTTIAHIIRALLAEDKTILLTSFTHTAVDNILLKIRDIAPPDSILRLGVPAKVNKEVQQFCQLAATPRKTIDEIEEAYMGSRIVATTCMGTNHALFRRRAFDVCIVDEASQITLPTALGPLLHARKFVLVGDHFQLPPLVQNRRALEGGLDVSLFRQLSEEHPEAVATLGRQYRMCEDIMSLSNTLIYDGKLRCGSEDVAQRALQLADDASLKDFHDAAPLGTVKCQQDRCWLADVTQSERKVVFANIDASGKEAHETLTSGKNITNQLEATLSAELVLSLIKRGVPAKDIGVITLYRSQLNLMRQLYRVAGISAEIEIDSADRYQGRDKECIILSFVRSNDAGIVGDLLKDWRRVNVALTRARSKLIMLGSRRTLVNNELLARLLSLTDRRGWTVDLPAQAHLLHAFELSSQTVASLVPKSTPSPKKRNAVTRTPRSSPLWPSQSAGNRGVPRPGMKTPGKIVEGIGKSSPLKDMAMFDIFEDLSADDF
ncbi:DNA replication endonuclease-helicase Dna2 [Recurvomyces mirabilis]|uniref:DNA replication ATP-dependent helicase/nuclease n=1 Tax=Recurvomyces mirabilis TaxID=574656 RepID=A0AAE0TM53_9PEZI|nr:DNA replication endonuclease-helicase Dna2 [Recurvomyces mirabilis]